MKIFLINNNDFGKKVQIICSNVKCIILKISFNFQINPCQQGEQKCLYKQINTSRSIQKYGC